MKKMLEAANHYIETSDWKTIAILKFCLISLGMLIGMSIDRKRRKPILLGALSVFIITYIPLMIRFYKVFTGKE